MMRMKKAILYTTLIGISIILFSCHKETSIENEKGLPPDMVALINDSSWEAMDSMATATFSQGFATISGIGTNGQEVSITLNDTVIGLYALNQTSSSLAIYANLDSVGTFAYSTNQGTDTSQAGGTVYVTALDVVNKTISGIFSFKVYRSSDGSEKNITNGVFYNIPYVDQ
jgi:hypothetical protein